MRIVITLLLALIPLSVTAFAASEEEDKKRFERFKTYDFKTHECTSEDSGSFQYSCRNIQTGDVSGYIKASLLEEDETGRLLGQYWGTNDRLKFVGIACGRSTTDAGAKGLAKMRAYQLVSRSVEAFETNVLTGKFKPLGYRKDEERMFCTKVERSADTPDVEASIPDAEDDSESDTNQSTELIEQQQREARLRDEQGRRRVAEERRQRETMIIVDVKSLDKYTVELSFYSQTHGNREWPGDGRVFILNDSQFHNYRLNCYRGEKICYGAWRRGNTNSYWGSGYLRRQSCGDCCMTCGGQFRYTLNGGSDGPQVSSRETLDALGSILGAAAGIAAQRSSPSSTPSYRSSPTPRGADRRPSGISGGR